ncbi:hypothetical protein PROFUN_14411 [Planoprotostelium fungivorum]|uniref:Uncharacterized protein n=1 Tax=Planoprotostelium fungivorum TaxID=1890364 RepID=A0A2P6MX70_9EUKA|nr:hypothetical protein PROFUN_14411 [Planoprotostelium fungivorum]
MTFPPKRSLVLSRHLTSKEGRATAIETPATGPKEEDFVKVAYRSRWITLKSNGRSIYIFQTILIGPRKRTKAKMTIMPSCVSYNGKNFMD